MSTVLRFPFQIDVRGGIASTPDVSLRLQQEVALAAGTLVGERVMRPDYGSLIYQNLLSKSDDSTFEDIKQQTRDAVSTLVREVTVIDVEATPTPTKNGVNVIIRYEQSNGVEGSVQTVIGAAAL